VGEFGIPGPDLVPKFNKMAEIEGVFYGRSMNNCRAFPHTSVESERAFLEAQIVPSLENDSIGSSSLIILIYSKKIGNKGWVFPGVVKCLLIFFAPKKDLNFIINIIFSVNFHIFRDK